MQGSWSRFGQMDTRDAIVRDTSMGLRSWRAAREEMIGSALRQDPFDYSWPTAPPVRVTVPSDVAVVLDATLAGAPPRSCAGCCRGAICMRSRVWRVRAWCGCWVLAGASTGNFSLVFTHSLDDGVPPLWLTVGISAAAVYVAAGMIFAMSTMEMARITAATAQMASGVDDRPSLHLGGGLLAPQEPDSQERRAAEQESPSQLFLRKLLTFDISEAASQVGHCF